MLTQQCYATAFFLNAFFRAVGAFVFDNVRVRSRRKRLSLVIVVSPIPSEIPCRRFKDHLSPAVEDENMEVGVSNKEGEEPEVAVCEITTFVHIAARTKY